LKSNQNHKGTAYHESKDCADGPCHPVGSLTFMVPGRKHIQHTTLAQRLVLARQQKRKPG